MKQHIRSIVIGAAVIAAIAASSVSAQPAQVPTARVCWAWQKQCIKQVWIFGRPVCTAWKMTCIKWL